ncbi:glycosyltransferase [Halocella sp. SP3-1]|uniref:glycosyltransferase n=1 Tax=Halocella sp. SP3-1 TaxID=2382161 RepID=UPI0013DF5D00|nr:glycosyltransferase [Halocella sp. SP3-1]
MKKILVYIDSMSPAGGIERVISNLTNVWSNKYKVFIIVKDRPYSFYELDPRISILSLDSPLRLNMDNQFSRIFNLIRNISFTHNKLKKNVKKIDPDIIYTANPVNSLEICLLERNYSKILIISEHGSKLGYNRIYNFIKKIVYPMAFKISVPTTLDTKLYKEEGLPAVFIPHLSTFRNQEKTVIDNKNILNIGRLTKDKQQLELLMIWNSIVKDSQQGDWKLRIVGRGEEKDRLLTYIKDNNLSNTVEISDPSKNVDVIFKSASIFAFTSRFEGFGMVLLEAMSFGIPCISFDCPSGPRDIIDDGINGYLIEDRNLKKYKKKLLELMNNCELRDRFSNESFMKANSWNNNEILKKWDDIFTSLR